MKPRKVVLTLEVETDAPLTVLNKDVLLIRSAPSAGE